jgi:hypothetical protein
MSWAKNKVRNWLADEVVKEDIMSIGAKASSFISNTYSNRLDGPGINFKVCKATGGYVVETSSYDPNTDRSKVNLHIITDDQDMGQEIGKILTMEALRHG